MAHHLGRTLLLSGMLVLLAALGIVSAIGIGVGARYEILPPFSAADRS